MLNQKNNANHNLQKDFNHFFNERDYFKNEGVIVIHKLNNEERIQDKLKQRKNVILKKLMNKRLFKDHQKIIQINQKKKK